MAPAAIAAVLIMAAALLLTMVDFSFLSGEEETSHIVLPDEETASVGVVPDGYAANLELLRAVEIDRTNIKRLIAAMQRPESYHIVASTTLYYSGGQRTTGADGYVSGGVQKTVVYDDQGGSAHHSLLYGDTVYIWNPSVSGYQTGKAGTFTQDDSLYIPTYEAILELEDEAILSAEYTVYSDIYCIAVETQDHRSGYRSLYYISVEDGLLVGAQSYEGDTLVYALTAEILPLTEDTNVLFRLPDGTVVGE